MIPQTAATQSGQHLSRGVEYYRAEQYERAIAELDQAIRLDSLQSRAYVLLASAYMEVNHLTEAERVAQKGLERFPDLVQLRIINSNVSWNIGDVETALNEYKYIERIADEEPGKLPADISRDELDNRIGLLYKDRGTRAYQADELPKAVESFRNAREYIPDTLEVHNNLTYLLIQSREWEDARDAARIALEHFPENKNLLQLKGQALYRLNDYTSLESVYEELYSRHPDDIEIGITYAQVLLQNQKFEQGLSVFESLLERFPEERKIYRAMQEVYEQSFRHQGAIAILKRKREAFPDDHAVVRELAETYEFVQDWDAAITMYDTLMIMTRDSVESKRAIAGIYEEMNKPEKALQQYRWLVHQDEAGFEVFRRMGGLYEELRQWDDALELYEAMYAAENHFYPLMRMGVVYEELGQVDEAYDMYTETKQMETTHPLPYNRLARIMYDRGEEGESIRLAELALQHALDGEKFLLERKYGFVQTIESEIDVRAVRDQQRTQEELDAYRQITTELFEFLTDRFAFQQVEPLFRELLQSSDASGRLYYYVAEFYGKHQYTDQAFQYYREATEASPRFRDAHIALGEMYEDEGEYRDAILSFERALAINPEKPEAYRALIRLYREQSQLDTLCDRWLARYQSQQDNQTLREHLIEALHKAGRYEEARAVVREN